MRKMIMLTGLLLLAGKAVYAVDNCYLFERGSDLWQNCKESVADSEKINEQLRQNMANIMAQNAQASANDSLAEQLQQQHPSKSWDEVMQELKNR